MIVVSDTTPLISLLKINRVDLLEKLFGEVRECVDGLQCAGRHISQRHYQALLDKLRD